MNNMVKFEVKEVYGVISAYETTKGYKRSKEVRKVSWNDKSARLDIRDWDAVEDIPGKGISLSFNEAKILRDILNEVLD